MHYIKKSNNGETGATRNHHHKLRAIYLLPAASCRYATMNKHTTGNLLLNKCALKAWHHQDEPREKRPFA